MYWALGLVLGSALFLLFLWSLARYAPEGHQDGGRFHFGKPQPPQPEGHESVEEEDEAA